MTIATHEFALCDLLFKARIRVGHHLGHVQEFVGCVIKIKHTRILLSYDQRTINTLSAGKFCLKEPSTTWGKILLLVAGAAVA